MSGQVQILSVGEGDLKISFDPANPAEAIRAARIVKDMLRRGYALLAEVAPGEYQRVLRFDENTHEYIIADFDPAGDDEVVEAPPKRGRPRKTKEVRLKAKDTKAVSIARTAGG